MYMHGKGKDEYLGEIIAPETKDPMFRNWKPRANSNKKGRENHVPANDGSQSTERSPFSKKQLDVLQTQSSLNSVSSLAQKGNFMKALVATAGSKSPWIVDSGASDHMTGDVTLFHNYNPCYEHLPVKIADGSLSKVVGTGSIVITKNLTLNSVLHVPKLDCNLLSVSKLTQDLNCVAKFSSNACEFQVLDSGRTIGNARICSGLFLLQVEEPSGGQTHNGAYLQSNQALEKYRYEQSLEHTSEFIEKLENELADYHEHLLRYKKIQN